MSHKGYVHNEVTLTCTNGFKTSKMLVKDRGVRIANGKLIATEEDKPCNFACKWAGVLAAIVAAACIAAPFIVAVLLAFVVGMVAALTLGQLLCWVALRGSKWTDFHPKVEIQGKKALVETSQLNCLLFSGTIKIFYDFGTAQQELRNNQFRNTIEIFGAAFIGRAFFSSAMSMGWSGAIKGFLMSMPKNLIIGYGIVEGANIITNIATGREVSENVGNSIPIIGKNDNVGDILQSDYAKTATIPLDVDSETKIIVDEKVSSGNGRFNDFEQKKIDQYKRENPIHKYKNGKKSPHYGRQQRNRQKLNTRAKTYGAGQRSRLSQRYQNQVQSTTNKNYTRANYGLLGFFALSEILAQYSEKTLDNSLQNENHPENNARKSVKVFAANL
ncbi:PAAR-like protein [Chryseobacterium sp. BIGb0232]|uniref:PAAR-like protein n=1 Tax=Chryseobacterium sp. BIGb0232 TaxID=2940598 RepID=UPI000F4A7723|nr:PAAR-like protein [Chryseobacterium sp. BIGb0232]MCS4305102.1 putative phage tail protein [Chryseobacterium sp. BIGb0232]ROS08082.1 uncharacterized protein DUF4280 [Chryseobacterium nakagawai]